MRMRAFPFFFPSESKVFYCNQHLLNSSEYALQKQKVNFFCAHVWSWGSLISSVAPLRQDICTKKLKKYIVNICGVSWPMPNSTRGLLKCWQGPEMKKTWNKSGLLFLYAFFGLFGWRKIKLVLREKAVSLEWRTNVCIIIFSGVRVGKLVVGSSIWISCNCYEEDSSCKCDIVQYLLVCLESCTFSYHICTVV